MDNCLALFWWIAVSLKVLWSLLDIQKTWQIWSTATNSVITYMLNADDTQVIASTTTANAELTVDRLQQCVAEIHRWCSSRRLQMNPKKTEFIWFGSCANLENLAVSAGTSSLTVTRDAVQRANCQCRITSVKSFKRALIIFGVWNKYGNFLDLMLQLNSWSCLCSVDWTAAMQY